ncbi:MAG: rhodanese-like domain-containing protein [Nocardioidaceae bacterium]
MDPRDTYQRRRDVQILDVREAVEWAAGHIRGAVHIPMRQIPVRLDEVARDRPVVAVCRSGHRSGHVVEYLRGVGIAAENMPGGLQQWAEEGLPLETHNHMRPADKVTGNLRDRDDTYP